jgi:UDP-N-acetylglucosamine acyltransferase
MTPRIHPTAVFDPGARVGPDVRVGPFAVIGPGVELARGAVIGAHAVLERDTHVGERCVVGTGAVLGADPQDVSYRGEPTCLEIGHDTRIREYATLHRGTTARGRTVVGSCCYLMAYVHVAHDCIVEDGVVLANGVQLGGHVQVGAYANIGGLTPVHQFVRIGRHAFVGGGSRVPQDVPPYARAAGNPIRLYGLNRVGLERAGMAADVQAVLKHAFRLLFNSHLTTSEAAERLRLEYGDLPEVVQLLDFVASSRRGVLV